MKKKVTTKKPKTKTLYEAVIDNNLPEEVAKVFRAYYEGFLRQSFSTDQAFQLTLTMLDWYLWKPKLQ
jgi:hypothetical protein